MGGCCKTKILFSQTSTFVLCGFEETIPMLVFSKKKKEVNIYSRYLSKLGISIDPKLFGVLPYLGGPRIIRIFQRQQRC